MFLAPEDIARLTGKARPTAQVRWLRNQGWRFAVNALGHPIVAVAEAERQLVGGGARAPRQPRWEALDGPQT